MNRAKRLTERVSPVHVQPDLPMEHKICIVRSILWAWAEVRQRWPTAVESGDEEAISAKLTDVLNEQDEDGVRLAPGLSDFETVHRGAKVEGGDGGVDYQPDLVFRPWRVPGIVRNRGHWGWFIECKLVNGTASVRRYCKYGVQRFVEGRYAGRMPSGAMLAYVRDGRQALDSLEPVLLGAYGNATFHPPDTSTPTELTSRHERRGVGRPRDTIDLTHVWLDAAVAGK